MPRKTLGYPMEGKQSIYTGKMCHQELSNSKPAGIKTW